MDIGYGISVALTGLAGTAGLSLGLGLSEF